MDIKPPKAPRPKPQASRKPDAVIDEAAIEEPTREDKQLEKAVATGTLTLGKRSWYRRIGWWWLAIVLALIALGGAGAWYKLAQFKPNEVTVNKAPVAFKPMATSASPLTGEPMSADQAKQPIIGVMIENLDPDARPQSGLSSAGVVYEALAEGGITRFLALFQEPLPTSIGPVRSLRPYYLDWALEYGAPVAHAGGSIPALQALGTTGAKDINALAYDGSAFFRTKDRMAPHNLYTTDVLLEKLDQQLGFDQAPAFTPIPRKKDTPSTGVAPHPTIDINFSYNDYEVQYKYDASTNSYARFMAGTAHIDRNTGKQIYVKNVVVLDYPTTYGKQVNGKPQTNIADTGSGKALVFTDGTVTAANWSKTSSATQTNLTDLNGQPIKLNVGHTWYEAVPTTNTVTY